MTYKNTIYSCFVGYIVQAIVNNFLPLLFITLQGQYDLPLSRITLLITVNFGIQLTVDLLSAFFVDKIGYRVCIVAAHVAAAAGFVLLTVLPEIMPPYAGIVIAVAVYAVGGGLLEVLVSPIMESCPTDNKETAMSLLHSFYCWGQVGVVLLSTVFFAIFGTANWKLLACLWAVIPVVNGLLFAKAPIAPLVPEDEKSMGLRELLSSKIFWGLFVMMVCAGASELAVSQWASFFAEKGLGISKTAGDLAGPMAFAVLMGGARVFYGKKGENLDLDKFMGFSSALCVLAYLMISLVPNPIVNLIGCAICGLSVGIMWPGTFSKAASSMKRGGTMMFSLLALAGDIGCAGGPTLVGFVADRTDMKVGVLAAALFPLGIALMTFLMRKRPAALPREVLLSMRTDEHDDVMEDLCPKFAVEKKLNSSWEFLIIWLVLLAGLMMPAVPSFVGDAMYPETVIGVEGLENVRKYCIAYLASHIICALLMPVLMGVAFWLMETSAWNRRSMENISMNRIPPSKDVGILAGTILMIVFILYDPGMTRFELQSKNNGYSDYGLKQAAMLLEDVNRDLEENEAVIHEKDAVHLKGTDVKSPAMRFGRRAASAVHDYQYGIYDKDDALLGQISQKDYYALSEGTPIYPTHSVETYKHSGLIKSIDGEEDVREVSDRSGLVSD